MQSKRDNSNSDNNNNNNSDNNNNNTTGLSTGLSTTTTTPRVRTIAEEMEGAVQVKNTQKTKNYERLRTIAEEEGPWRPKT